MRRVWQNLPQKHCKRDASDETCLKNIANATQMIKFTYIDNVTVLKKCGVFARGIVAEPPNRMNEMNAVKVMERIARRERAKPAKRLAQSINVLMSWCANELILGQKYFF